MFFYEIRGCLKKINFEFKFLKIQENKVLKFKNNKKSSLNETLKIIINKNKIKKKIIKTKFNKKIIIKNLKRKKC